MNLGKRELLKTIILFIIYASYTTIFSTILGLFHVDVSILSLFLIDVVFLIAIVFFYKNKIKNNFNSFFTKRSILKNILFIIKWVVILFIITFIEGVIYEAIFPNYGIDDNTKTVYSLADMSAYYTIFKTMIFAVVAEELVFKQSIRNVIQNSTVFIIISGLLYSIMNVAYSTLSVATIADFIQCFIFFSVLSYVYLKEEDNIISIMIIKFCYNLIPLAILLLGLGG